MNSPQPSPRLNPVFDLTSRLAAAAVAVLGLTGWATNLELLKSLHPRWVAMNPLTAVCFILCGAALWLLRRPQGDFCVLPNGNGGGAALRKAGGLIDYGVGAVQSRWVRGAAALCAAAVAALAFMKLSD